MNLLFRRKFVYTPQLPAEQVQHKVQFICNRRFDDYATNLIGYVKPDGQFKMTHKWGFTEKRWIENRDAYLYGGIRREGELAAVEVNLRPNILYIILFYIASLLFLLELLSVRLIPLASKEIRLAVLGALVMLATAFIVRATNQLRNRFEHLMQLN